MRNLFIPIIAIVFFLGMIALSRSGSGEVAPTPAPETVAKTISDKAPVEVAKASAADKNLPRAEDVAATPVSIVAVPATVATAKTDTSIIPENGVPAPPAPIDPSDPAVPEKPLTARLDTMKNSSDPLLKKLAQYETCCGSAIGKMMVFTSFPNGNEAVEMADEMAQRLKDFAAAGVMPIVAVEPVDGEGDPFSFSKIAAGDNDRALRSYFGELKARGIDDARMGLWIPIPEPNLDEWGEKNHDPADFGAAYNRFARILREYFPATRLTVLLDNETYDVASGETELVSLLPWVAAIDHSLVDSFGLQGYPWSAPADAGDEKDFDAASFLNADRAIEAARALAVGSMWFSTGTFSEEFSDNDEAAVYVEAETRGAILAGILSQAKIVRAAGYGVMICIFSEDKSDTPEATDFSYWHDAADFEGGDAAVFKSFAAAAAAENIPLAIYDSE